MWNWVILVVGVIAVGYGILEFFFTETVQTKSEKILPEDRLTYTKQGGLLNLVGGGAILLCAVANRFGMYQNALLFVCVIYFICAIFRDKPYHDRKKQKRG